MDDDDKETIPLDQTMEADAMVVAARAARADRCAAKAVAGASWRSAATSAEAVAAAEAAAAARAVAVAAAAAVLSASAEEAEEAIAEAEEAARMVVKVEDAAAKVMEKYLSPAQIAIHDFFTVSLSSPSVLFPSIESLNQATTNIAGRMFSYATLRDRFKQLIDAAKKSLENTRELAKEELLAFLKHTIDKRTRGVIDIYNFYLYITVIFDEIPFLMTHNLFGDIVMFLKMTFSLYKIIVPGLPYLKNFFDYIKQRYNIRAEQLELVAEPSTPPSIGLIGGLISELERLNPQELIDFFNENRNHAIILEVVEVFKILYTFGKNIAIIGETALILVNAAIDLPVNLNTAIDDIRYLRQVDNIRTFALECISEFADLTIYFINGVVSIFAMPPLPPQFEMVGGIKRRKKTIYYKRKNRQPKQRLTHKFQNEPFIQTKEFMLSSYLINNNKPIIRGYSIQKKIIPNKKLISVHASIIRNNNRPKTKKNRKHRKKLKK